MSNRDAIYRNVCKGWIFSESIQNVSFRIVSIHLRGNLRIFAFPVQCFKVRTDHIRIHERSGLCLQCQSQTPVVAIVTAVYRHTAHCTVMIGSKLRFLCEDITDTRYLRSGGIVSALDQLLNIREP